MTVPNFLITDPQEGDILVYSSVDNAFINVPSSSVVGRILLYCNNLSISQNSIYNFSWGGRYTFVAELVGHYSTSDININISLVADSDYPLSSQFGSSNLLRDDNFLITIPSGSKYGSIDIIFSDSEANDQINPVYGKIFTSTLNTQNSVIVNNLLNNYGFSIDNPSPQINLPIFYGYSNGPLAPTLQELYNVSIIGAYRYINQYFINPVSANFVVVCDSPYLQTNNKYYWLIMPVSFNHNYGGVFDGSVILPYTINNVTYKAYYKMTLANYLVLKTSS